MTDAGPGAEPEPAGASDTDPGQGAGAGRGGRSAGGPDLSPTSAVTTPFLDELDAVHRETGLGRYDVFRDWLQLTVAALAAAEDDYRAVVDRYRERHGREAGAACIERYAAAFGALWVATIEADHEVLGLAYEQLGMTSDAFGQHFTPHHVSDMLARLTVAADASRGRDDPLTVHDPACGSGRLLISAAKHVHGLDDPPRLFLSGQDKDPVCARMTVVNLAIAGLWGDAIHGDAFRDHPTRVYRSRPWRVPPVRIDDDPRPRHGPDGEAEEAVE